MIDELHVRNLALIADATMAFDPGLTVLTGETGAGKTALLGAIKLIVGGRADAGAVRDGAAEISVEASFARDSLLAAALAELGIEGEEPAVVARRRVSADGRSKCTVDGAMSNVRDLARTVGRLVELHGQHEHQELMAPANHIRFLDRWSWGTVGPRLEAYRASLARFRALEAEHAAAVEASRASDYQLEQARFVCGQIGAVNPGPAEYAELEAQLPVLRNGEALASSASEALALLRSEEGALDLLSRAQAGLARMEGTDERLDAIAARLAGQVADIEDACMELRAYRDEVEFDPVALQEALDRLGELDGLVRRFGPTYEAMLGLWDDMRSLVENAEGAGDRISKLERQLAKAREELSAAARALEEARTEAAQRFCPELADDLAELSMRGASFAMGETALDIADWGPQGSKRYELLYSPAPGVAPRPLAKIASGGELSRVMLSLECLINSAADGGDPRAPRKTLVFDEVDAGIGGATAQAVAARLESLAARQQVVVVTHLAQIAAVADRHLLVEKILPGDGVAEAGVRTEIRAIAGDERVREVARMLSGSTDRAALEHAASLLGSAKGEVPIAGEGD